METEEFTSWLNRKIDSLKSELSWVKSQDNEGDAQLIDKLKMKIKCFEEVLKKIK